MAVWWGSAFWRAGWRGVGKQGQCCPWESPRCQVLRFLHIRPPRQASYFSHQASFLLSVSNRGLLCLKRRLAGQWGRRMKQKHSEGGWRAERNEGERGWGGGGRCHQELRKFGEPEIASYFTMRRQRLNRPRAPCWGQSLAPLLTNSALRPRLYTKRAENLGFPGSKQVRWNHRPEI